MDILGSIVRERTAQDAKWGVHNHSDPWWLTILMEEIGEAAKAMLDGDGQAVIDELVQVAAVAVAWLECIDRRQTRWANAKAPNPKDKPGA